MNGIWNIGFMTNRTITLKMGQLLQVFLAACIDKRSKRMVLVLEGICIRSFFMSVRRHWLVS